MMGLRPRRSSAKLGFLVVAFTTACADSTGRELTAPSSAPMSELEGPSLLAAPNSWTTKRPMLLPARADMKAARLNGKIYVVGGQTFDSDQYLRNLDVYDVASNTWSTRRPLPGGRSLMCGFSVIGGKLYTVGGLRTTVDGVRLSRSLYVYDPETDTWDKKANIPVDAIEGTQGVIAGKLYVHVGTISMGADSVFFRYDPATDTWTKRASPPSQHMTGQAEIINGKYYLVGGEGGPDLLPTKLLHVYDPTTDTWTTRAPMSERLGRMRFASGVVNGKLYIAGGRDGGPNTLASTEVYDPATNTWAPRASMLSTLTGMASAVAGGKLFVIGGNDDSPGFTRKVQAFTP
jgi:N-acetylneuraminic acid mutarotase